MLPRLWKAPDKCPIRFYHEGHSFEVRLVPAPENADPGWTIQVYMTSVENQAHLVAQYWGITDDPAAEHNWYAYAERIRNLMPLALRKSDELMLAVLS